MHVLVLGAGVVGVTTAYYLSQLGCRVTVVDRAGSVADAASYANGAQLSYSFTDALARPEFLAKIPGVLLGRSLGSRVRLEPGLFGWGLGFLAQCTSRRARDNTIAMLRIAMRSAELLDELRASVPIEFGHRVAGKLVLLGNRAELQTAERNCRLKNRHGCDTELLTRDEAIAVEPAVQAIRDDVLAAVYSRNDEVADSRIFSERLRAWLERSRDVAFRLNTNVDGIAFRGGRAIGVRAGEEILAADATCVCLGAWSRQLLRGAGVDSTIYPVRGYSVTLPARDTSPSVSITALKHRMVFSRINGLVRIAGFADFTGFDASADERRTNELLGLAKVIAPEAADYGAADPHGWGGFRPMTPNGRPRVGATPVPGLFTNTGHGMLGWTLACASAADAAEAIVMDNREKET
jgi:D-amino-acid dehydrogenase